MRVSFEEMKDSIKKAFLKAGLSEDQAELCAQTHTESSRDGVYSHGLNRVARFVDYVQNGWVNLDGKLELVKAIGNIENYDGNLGIGITNAKECMNRAMELGKTNGFGIVTLKNTTHWMRGGTYAWDAANAGMLSICWTNTESCMPVWGSKSPSVGNNPLCLGIPHKDGNVVLDMAMSQYSYGKLQVTRLAEKELPLPGGFDKDGNLTSDPGAIEESRRILPTGYWKGSGLAIVLDLAAAVLSNGITAGDMDRLDKGSCGGCSQIFMAFDPYMFGTKEQIEKMLEDAIEHFHSAVPEHEGGSISYPGERTTATRRENEEKGIPVDEGVWSEVIGLSK